ncbi:acidic repeat-containing protein isoform X2 [Sarcophilus harrisii]|uniref:acidic repeat-containing protein isoform X2 n=1 Tax=Sarcophilus harrisii TaxID=9305 RepID=UPI000C7CDA59|nr:acidic repeat-containing protein isoform X2 [Sarcophilus harrisii]
MARVFRRETEDITPESNFPRRKQEEKKNRVTPPLIVLDSSSDEEFEKVLSQVVPKISSGEKRNDQNDAGTSSVESTGKKESGENPKGKKPRKSPSEDMLICVDDDDDDFADPKPGSSGVSGPRPALPTIRLTPIDLQSRRRRGWYFPSQVYWTSFLRRAKSITVGHHTMLLLLHTRVSWFYSLHLASVHVLATKERGCYSFAKILKWKRPEPSSSALTSWWLFEVPSATWDVWHIRMCRVAGCFLADLSNPTCEYVRYFQWKKTELTWKLYHFFNDTIFNKQLPEKMTINWNNKMRTTAGYCHFAGKKGGSQAGRSVQIELSEKVCDSADRLRDTLIHELCHGATWLFHGIRDCHGPFWRVYAQRSALVHPELPVVKRCHTYEIHYKFIYECSCCEARIGRHSKSVNTSRAMCSLCHGHLRLLPPNQNMNINLSKVTQAIPIDSRVRRRPPPKKAKVESPSKGPTKKKGGREGGGSGSQGSGRASGSAV